MASVTNWHPNQTYTWTRQDIVEWIDIYGGWAFYNGKRYSIKTKKIFGDRYEVTFKDIDL